MKPPALGAAVDLRLVFDPAFFTFPFALGRFRAGKMDLLRCLVPLLAVAAAAIG
jgi:hypothetical protein